MPMPLIKLGENRINLFNVTHVTLNIHETTYGPPGGIIVWFTGNDHLRIEDAQEAAVFLRYWDEVCENLAVDLTANEQATTGPVEHPPLDLGRGGSHAP